MSKVMINLYHFLEGGDTLLPFAAFGRATVVICPGLALSISSCKKSTSIVVAVEMSVLIENEDIVPLSGGNTWL